MRLEEIVLDDSETKEMTKSFFIKTFQEIYSERKTGGRYHRR